MDRRPLPDDTTRIDRPAGTVRRDAQGNAVWQWAANTGRQALDSTSRLLRRLEVPGLRVLDEDTSPGGGRNAAGRGGAGAQGGSAGYDPYGGRGASIAARAGSPQRTKSPRPAVKPSLLSRLFGRR